jgi:hypothetical protein
MFNSCVMSSTVKDLHNAAFGFRPPKAGAAYERLAALVLAILGWEDVTHNVVERSLRGQASHQLDVTATHPDGAVRRLLVECKDWDKTVGKETLDALVGVRSQVGADAAAAMTREGFTRGARLVAADEDVALLRLRPYDPSRDEGGFIRRVELTLDFYVPRHTEFDVELEPDHGLPSGEEARISMGVEDRLLFRDGTPAERIEQVLRAHAAPMRDGVYSQRAEFAEGRLMPTTSGDRVAIRALTWREIVSHRTHTSVTEFEGEPLLVFEQLDSDGNPYEGRLVVDRDLYSWDIRPDGRVVQRGHLGEKRRS